MGLSATEVLNIIKPFLGGQIRKTPLGAGVTCSPRSAYLLSALTGSTYFDSHIFPFTPKGLLKVFNSVNEYKMVGGLFDGISPANSPTCEVRRRSYIFQGTKIVVPIEIDSEKSLRRRLREAYGEEGTDVNLLILKVEVSKRGHGLESLMEYVASQIYSNKGYITETQLPLSHTLGSPDFFALRDSNIQQTIKKEGGFSGGFNVIELAMLSTFGNVSNDTDQIEEQGDEIVVGEAKTSTTNMEEQIHKYCSSGIFSSAIEIHPTKKSPSAVEFGLLNLLGQEPRLIPPKLRVDRSNKKSVTNFKYWFESYLKAYLIGNYTKVHLMLLYQNLFSKTMTTRADLVRLIRDVPLRDHLQILKGYLANGCLERRVYKERDHRKGGR